MNITDNFTDVFFTVARAGEFKIVVKQGCIFNYNGQSKLVANMLQIGGFGVPYKLMPYPIESSEVVDDLGTHVYIDEQEFEVSRNNNSKVWLRYNISEVSDFYRVSLASDTGESLYESFGNNSDEAHADIEIKNHILAKDSVGYELRNNLDNIEEGTRYILLANVTIDQDNNHIVIEQVHRGIYVHNRFQEIIPTA